MKIRGEDSGWSSWGSEKYLLEKIIWIRKQMRNTFENLL